jgi:hypothetical protein
MDWHRLRQQGFLTAAIVLACATLVDMILPMLDFREALLTIALVALLLGWIP